MKTLADYPDLIKEWHPFKNCNLSPKNFTHGSHKKVWWLCSKNKCHEWEAIIYKRSIGRSCPYCSGRRTLNYDLFE